MGGMAGVGVGGVGGRVVTDEDVFSIFAENFFESAQEVVNREPRSLEY